MRRNRKKQMLYLYVTGGLILEDIGERYEITRERVRQILTTFPEYHQALQDRVNANQVVWDCIRCGKKNITYKRLERKYCSNLCHRGSSKSTLYRLGAKTLICRLHGEQLKEHFYVNKAGTGKITGTQYYGFKCRIEWADYLKGRRELAKA